ncbi:MAG TPA: 4-hydroxy-3-methylbut-2-enyl diphosphate reductase [Defluviitoga sp.]|nr:4-hydroxy-3-methylbut-2-enyl diphosphate reductase [Defluviitoga sp.]HOP24275.1 4-hydroxy-3-methylbut-2-enyl diphosphate reductase [Defluviitoga sp.]HPZ28133.1 4-hydroxy-3-methylbut-2-enyl diphosphate reductase [Defluviitoga sp.]HQD62023.1 4-hydroxy-3-methylbut-2-enyl diphosphate reductase [Defluviitoga sp.]
MEIIVAKRTGFCFGVSRAIEEVKKVLDEKKEVYIYGELVHNKQVMNELKELGATVINNLEEIPEDSNSKIVVIRAHGVTKKEKEVLENNFLEVVDMTCPIVENLVKFVKQKQKKNYYVVLYGKPDHPEVVGLRGNVEEEKLLITSSPLEIKVKKTLIVSQTTMAESDFKEFIVGMIKCNSFSEVLIKKTICSETIIREQETFSLSKKCDLILVIGGKHSSNTEKLYNIAKKNCKRTFHIEKVEELEQIDINSSDVVGIVTGSSTPEIELERVINFLEKFKS